MVAKTLLLSAARLGQPGFRYLLGFVTVRQAAIR
jgi:hypothetical protein